MSQVGDRPRVTDVAIDWYKQGRCPGCGKRFGERRGLEYRSRSEDLYCHTCKKSWPIELDIRELQDEFSRLWTPLPDVFSFPEHDPLVQEESDGRTVVSRFSSLFQRLMARH